MKPFLFTLTLIAGCVSLLAPAHAQSALPQGSAAATTAPRSAVGAPSAPGAVALAATGSTDARAPARTPGTVSITAAGSVIILADGIVANAAIAQIQPPAPGFVYER